MKPGEWLLLLVGLLLAGAIAADRLYVAGFEERFKTVERERIITSNKLATAKIVSENLNHVRDLVFKNMDFPGHLDSATQETIFFEFVTACINDLKMKVVSVKPSRPATVGMVTVFGYDIELEGDFFSYGELCAKFENSRRIIAVKSFEVELLGVKGAMEAKRMQVPLAGPEGIRVKMHVETFRVKKG